MHLGTGLCGQRSLTRTLPSDSLKCIAWKGRAIVVGFAAGSIEKVGLTTGRHRAGEELIQTLLAASQPSSAEEHLYRRDPLGRIH